MTFQGWSGTTFEKSVQATAMKLTILVLTGVLFAGIVLAEVSVQETEKSLVVTNAHSQLTIHQKEEGVGIVLSARDGGALTPLCRSFKPDPTKRSSGNKLFDTTVTPHRFQAAEMAKRFELVSSDEKQAVVRLTGQDEKITFTQEFTIEADSPAVHVRLIGELSADKLDYLMSSWEFVAGYPDFVHSPTAKHQHKQNHFHSGPAQDQVIGDHAFHTPHITLQKDDRFVALIPDLDMINEHTEVSPDARRTQRVKRNQFSVPIVDEFYTMPTALDLNAQTGYTQNPVFSYGMMDFIVAHHVRYPRVNDTSMVRTIPDKEVQIGYTLLVGVDQEPGTSFQQAVRFIWDEYGHKQFTDEAHLAMPFEQYVKDVYDVVSKPMPPAIQKPVPGHEDMGVFVEFELDGRTAGGMVSPLPFYGPVLWNFEFWNNLRDANGLVYWGERLGDKKMAERGRHIINLALSAPRNEAGFFPLVYMPDKKQWLTSTLGPSPSPRHIFHRGTGHVHNVVAMSKSAAHMIEYYKRCEQDPAIIDYLTPFADTLVKEIDSRGAIPSYYTPDMKPIQDLWHSAQPAAMMWFLAEMASVTGEKRYRQGAEKIADYLINEILPEAKWVDLEVYYSCGRNELEFLLDPIQNLPIRGNLSIHWASKGFQVLYQITKDPSHLKAGEIATDYLAQSQGSWNPHYIYTANPFGGCTVDNVDTATWLDARQCELVQPFIWYGLELGRQDLVERGIAAARASTVLINHPRHIENGIYPHVNIYGFGLGPENINHEGHNQSAMRTHPSWGECSGIFTGLADAARFAGGGIIDLKSGIAVGVDGINLSLEKKAKAFHITATGRLAKLKNAWEKPYDIELRIRGHKEQPIYMNGVLASVKRAHDSSIIRCQIMPDGDVIPEKDSN